MEEDFSEGQQQPDDIFPNPPQQPFNRSQLEILNLRKEMVAEGIVFIPQSRMDDYVSIIYPFLPNPSNISIYARHILNINPDDIHSLVTNSEQNILPNNSGASAVFRQNQNFASSPLPEILFIPKVNEMIATSRALLGVPRRPTTRSQLRLTPQEEFFVDCQSHILASAQKQNGCDIMFQTIAIMLLHLDQFHQDFRRFRYSCRSTYEFQVLFGSENTLSTNDNLQELTSRNQLLITRSTELFRSANNGVDLESYIQLLFTSRMSYSDNQELWSQLRSNKFEFKNRLFFENELQPELRETNLAADLRNQFTVLRSSMTTILDHIILYGSSRATLYLMLIHIQRLFLILEKRKILKPEFKQYCYLVFSPLACLTLYQMAEPTFTHQNWSIPTHHIMNFQINACLKVNREMWNFLRSHQLLLKGTFPHDIFSLQIYESAVSTNVAMLSAQNNLITRDTGFRYQIHLQTQALRDSIEHISSFQTIVLSNNINHIFESVNKTGQLLFQSVDRLVSSQTINPILLTLLSEFLLRFVSLYEQSVGYSLIIVFLVYKLDVSENQLNQQYLTISESVPLDGTFTIQTMQRLTKRIIEQLVVDSLDAYYEYADEMDDSFFESTLKISKASAYRIKVSVQSHNQFSVLGKKRNIDSQQRPVQKRIYRPTLGGLAQNFGYNHDLSHQYDELKPTNYFENDQVACGIQVLRYFYQALHLQQIDIQSFLNQFDCEEFEDAEIFDIYWKKIFPKRITYGIFIPKIGKWYNKTAEFQIVWDSIQSHIFPSTVSLITNYINKVMLEPVAKKQKKMPWSNVFKLDRITYVKSQKYIGGVLFEDKGCILTNLYFDIETYLTEQGEHIPYLLCAYNKTNNQYSTFLSFEDPELVTFAFVNQIYQYLLAESQITKKKCIINVWSFNGAKFDIILILKVLYQQFQHFEFQIMGTVNNIKTLYVNLTAQCSVVFYDFILLSPLGSLKEQCAFYQVSNPKGDLKISDYTNLELIKQNIDIIIDYCKLDCLSLCECHNRYIEKLLGFGVDFPNKFNIKPFLMSGTISQLSLKFFQNCFVYEPIFGTNSPEIYEAETQSYYGGCTQVFEYGQINQRLAYVDINSMYPFIMANYPMPSKANELQKVFFDESDLQHGLIFDNALYEVSSFSFLNTHKPNLPVRTKSGLIYPRTHDKPSWRWGCELNINKFSLKLSITAVINYPTESNLFCTYVNYLYEKRKASKCEIEKKLLKLLMNNLYGKFAQKPLDNIGICSENLLHLYNVDDDFDDNQDEQERKNIIETTLNAHSKKKVFEELSRIKSISPLKDGICLIKKYRNQTDFKFVGSLV